MGKHRELASVVSRKLWRTVVVAGAMLAAPACGGSKKPATTTPTPVTEPAGAAKPAEPDDAAKAKAEADQKAADEAKILADKQAADKAEADQKAQDEADQKAAEDARKKRPRGGGDRPTGRGFVLS